MKGKPITIGVIAIYAILFFWLFDRYFVLRGSWSAADGFESASRIFSAPVPHERVQKDREKGDAYYKILSAPVYFDIKTPRRFQEIELGAWWRGSAPVIEAGLVINEDPWQVEMKTLYNKYLEELSWPRIEKEGLALWQKNLVYQSVADFLNNPPPPNEIVAVNAPNLKFTKPNFESRPKALRSYQVSLRGPQNIFVAITSPGLDLRFLVQDLNRHDGADPISATLRDMAGKIILTNELVDDGQEWNSTKLSALRELGISERQIQPGVYRVVFEASDDIAIREIRTSAAKMVFKNQLYLGDEVGYRAGTRSLTVWSNGQGYALRTPHPESLQAVRLEPSFTNKKSRLEVSLTEHNKQYSILLPREIAGDLVAIETPKRDLILNSDGFFALSAEDFFWPEPLQWNADLDLDRLGINYVIANYNFSAERKEWKTTALVLNNMQTGARPPLRTVFGVPIGAGPEFDITRLQIKGHRERLTSLKIWRKLKEVLELR